MELNDKEQSLYDNLLLRKQQLHTFQRILAQPLPKKKAAHYEKNILPQYITRMINAENAAKKVLEKLSHAES